MSGRTLQIAGALLEAEWNWVLEHAGFTDVRWGPQVDAPSPAPSTSPAQRCSITAALHSRG